MPLDAYDLRGRLPTHTIGVVGKRVHGPMSVASMHAHEEDADDADDAVGGGGVSRLSTASWSAGGISWAAVRPPPGVAVGGAGSGGAGAALSVSTPSSPVGGHAGGGAPTVQPSAASAAASTSGSERWGLGGARGGDATAAPSSHAAGARGAGAHGAASSGDTRLEERAPPGLRERAVSLGASAFVALLGQHGGSPARPTAAVHVTLALAGGRVHATLSTSATARQATAPPPPPASAQPALLQDSALAKRILPWRWRSRAQARVWTDAEARGATFLQRLLRGWLTRRGVHRLQTLHTLSQFSTEWLRGSHLSARDRQVGRDAPPSGASTQWVVRLEKFPDGAPVLMDFSVLVRRHVATPPVPRCPREAVRMCMCHVHVHVSCACACACACCPREAVRARGRSARRGVVTRAWRRCRRRRRSCVIACSSTSCSTSSARRTSRSARRSWRTSPST